MSQRLFAEGPGFHQLPRLSFFFPSGGAADRLADQVRRCHCAASNTLVSPVALVSTQTARTRWVHSVFRRLRVWLHVRWRGMEMRPRGWTGLPAFESPRKAPAGVLHPQRLWVSHVNRANCVRRRPAQGLRASLATMAPSLPHAAFLLWGRRVPWPAAALASLLALLALALSHAAASTTPTAAGAAAAPSAAMVIRRGLTS